MTDFETLKKWVDQSWRAQGEWREAAQDDFAFIAGHQWTDSERSTLEDQSRVPIVFNRCAVIIGTVAGSEINNRTEVRFIPREIGDAKPNEVLTAGSEWFRDVANSEDEDSAAFEDLLTCGIGATETTLDWEEDPEGEPSEERINPTEMGWDMHAHRKGLTDARYFFRVMKKPREEAEERFPGFEISELDASWIKTVSESTPHRNVVGDQYRESENSEEDDDENKDTVTIVQVQWREREKTVEFVNPQTGQRDTMDQSQWDAINKRIPLNIPSRSYNKWVWHQAFLGRSGILDRNQPDPEGSTFNFMTGHWDSKKRLFFGLLRSMKDPQKFANKWLSQTLHIINSNAKGGVMVEANAVEDINEFEDSWSAADGVTWMKEGAIRAGKLAEKPKAQMPAALMSLTQFAISSIRETSGVNMELLGLRDANQPGVLEYQRRQSAMTTMARYFDSLRFYRKRQGRTILNMLRNHIAPSGRMVRLVRDDQEQYVPLAMDDGTEKYDVIVDDAPSAPNEKEKAWSVIQAMMPMLQQADLGMDDWADILEYSPLPASFADKVREKAKAAQKDGPSPEQQQMMHLAMQKEESEIAENMANAQLDGVKAAQISQESQLMPIKTLAEIMNTPQGASPV